MPITSHVSSMRYPFVSRGMNACTTFGLDGSDVSNPWMPSCVQTGVRLPKAFFPVNL